jgi:hypothetical protein
MYVPLEQRSYKQKAGEQRLIRLRAGVGALGVAAKRRAQGWRFIASGATTVPRAQFKDFAAQKISVFICRN